MSRPPLPSLSRTGGLLRRLLIPAILAVVILTAYGVSRIGPYLAREDGLQKADAVVVLAGTKLLRPLEAADLYREGYAPSIVLTRDFDERPAFDALAHRGVDVAMDADRARGVMVSLGIPRDAIVIPDRLHDSTAAEAVTLRELAAARGWRRLIVVSSRFHLARARFALEREMGSAGPQIIMHATRYDPLRPEGWWTRRAEIRWVASEVPKFIAYLFGLSA